MIFAVATLQYSMISIQFALTSLKIAVIDQENVCGEMTCNPQIWVDLFSYDGSTYQNYSDSNLTHTELRDQSYLSQIIW